MRSSMRSGCFSSWERARATAAEQASAWPADLLERKPGAFAGSKPLEQWRQAGRWPTSYDRLWQALMQRQGRQLGTKTMIELLQLGREHGFARLRVAIEAALDLGCTDAAAV